MQDFAIFKAILISVMNIKTYARSVTIPILQTGNNEAHRIK